jgi:hypothetical protein
LKEHIYKFYKKLFGSEQRGQVRLAKEVWEKAGRLDQDKVETLIKPFTLEKVESALKEMKTETAPGPDGFPMIFFKKFWGILKWWIIQMMEDFYNGRSNLSRINCGVIVLIPELKDVVNIKKFRPICLLNVFYKLFTKVLAMRWMEVASEVISKNQTTFVKSRNILDGVIVLHEVLHELHPKKNEGIIVKLDFGKAYDKVNWGF